MEEPHLEIDTEPSASGLRIFSGVYTAIGPDAEQAVLTQKLLQVVVNRSPLLRYVERMNSHWYIEKAIRHIQRLVDDGLEMNAFHPTSLCTAFDKQLTDRYGCAE